jgi:hypothetical protein
MKRTLLTSLTCLSFALPAFAAHTPTLHAASSKHARVAAHTRSHHPLASKKSTHHVVTAHKASKKLLAHNGKNASKKYAPHQAIVKQPNTVMTAMNTKTHSSVTRSQPTSQPPVQIKIPQELRQADNASAEKPVLDFVLTSGKQVTDNKEAPSHGTRGIMI